MDAEALRWFQFVADGTTVTEVSQLHGVTQPGVSRALARLEDEVGVALLRKSGRTLRMTSAGAAFKRHVDLMLHELDDGLAALAQLASPDTGTVSLAFQLSLGTWLVPRLVARFGARYPDVGFDLVAIRDEVSGSPLAQGRADIEITTVTAADDTRRWRPLLAQPLRVAVPETHPLAGRTSVALRELTDERFVMLRPAYALRRSVDALCERAGFTPTVAFEGDDVPTVEGFVAAGLGVGVVPADRRGQNGSNGLRLLAIEDAGASRDVGIAWTPDRQLLPAAERFRRFVIDRAHTESIV